MKRSDLLNTLAFYAQRLIPGGLSVAMLPWLFAHSGAAIYQHYSISLLLIGTVGMFWGSWISQASMRNLSTGGYNRRSLQLTWQLVFLSAAAAAFTTAAWLVWVFPGSSAAPSQLAIAAALFTVQSAALPLLQAIGMHMSCLLSELFRTVGTVVFVAWVASPQAPIASGVETAIMLGTGLSVLALSAAAVGCWRSAAEAAPSGPLHTRRAMWTYGGPLSLYNGLSMWLQYLARASLVTLSGTHTGGAQVFVSDLTQKLIGSMSAPLVASKVPAMITAYNEGRRDSVNRTIFLLQLLIAGGALALALVAGVAGALHAWVFRSPDIVICGLITVVANALLQLAVCAQKRLEFMHRTGLVALSMIFAAVATYAAVRLLPVDLRTSLPGVELLCGALVLYVGVRWFDRTSVERLAEADTK